MRVKAIMQEKNMDFSAIRAGAELREPTQRTAMLRNRKAGLGTASLLVGILLAMLNCNANPNEFGWNVVFAKSTDSRNYILIKPFSSRNGGVPHEFPSFDAMLGKIPKSDYPRYFLNFDQTPPGFSVEGLTLVPLSPGEIDAIEKHVRAKCFQRESDITHPTLE